MSANFYCWEPTLGLEPTSKDFNATVMQLHKPPFPEPSAAMLKFIDALLSKYPDLTETEDTVWTDGPLRGNIIGAFINMGIMFSRYAEAVPVIIEIAHRHGLDAYDPQDGSFYPANKPSN